MEKIKNIIREQKFIAIVISILIIFSGIGFIKGKIGHSCEIVKIKEIHDFDRVKDFHIGNKTIFVWNGNTLALYDKEGNLIKTINRKEEKQEIFFTDNYAFIYDVDLKKLYQYSEEGEHQNTIKCHGDVMDIKYQNNNIILHMKENETEYLYTVQPDGVINEIYKTDNYIFSYEIKEEKENYAIAEMVTSASGYKTNFIVVLNGQKIEKENYSEVGLYVGMLRNSAILVTEKNIYKTSATEEIYTEIPNVSDVLIDGNKIYLLHSGIISKYNGNLKEKEKYILAANVEKLKKVSNSLYAYGKSDIGGELGRRNEYYTRIGTSIEKIKINGLTIGAMKDGKINLYKIINAKETKSGAMKDLSKYE